MCFLVSSLPEHGICFAGLELKPVSVDILEAMVTLPAVPATARSTYLHA
jgi:hypothetical protein